MKFFDQIMESVKQECQEASFHDYIREARDRIGLKQYRAAEHCGITLGRLRNLESGYYRQMPGEEELRRFAELYELPYDVLYEKAEEYVNQRQRDRKVRIIEDGSSAVPHMQAN